MTWTVPAFTKSVTGHLVEWTAVGGVGLSGHTCASRQIRTSVTTLFGLMRHMQHACGVQVPPGTVVRAKGAAEEEPPLAEMVHAGDQALLMTGGRGGRGNASFKSGWNKSVTLFCRHMNMCLYDLLFRECSSMAPFMQPARDLSILLQLCKVVSCHSSPPAG